MSRLSDNDLWTLEQQRESAIPLSPLMQRLEALEREVREIKRTMSMPELRMPPEEQWRDVTGECEVRDGMLFHKEKPFSYACPASREAEGYRFRKVQLCKRGQLGLVDAFIIERKD